MGMLKIKFWRQNAKIHFSQQNGKTPLHFFYFFLFAIDVSQKQKKSEKNHAGYAVDPYM